MAEPPHLRDLAAKLSRGDLIAAYDDAKARLDAEEDHPRLRYLGVLALTRAGATREAARRYVQLGLRRQRDEDSRSLWARILKDVAVGAPPATRARLLRRAARAYGRVFRRARGYFPGINAATLLLLAGDDAAAERLARGLLATDALTEPADYWSAATRGEALLILGRLDEAGASLAAARRLAGADYGALSSTRRQLSLVGRLRPDRGPVDTLLAALRPPRVASLGDHPDAGAGLGERLQREGVGFAVGTLWTDGAVAAAEAALAAGAELHLVLPYGEADYLRRVAQDRPPERSARHSACLAAAATVTAVTADGDVADPHLIAYAAAVARGLARTKARLLTTDCVELGVAAADSEARSPSPLTTPNGPDARPGRELRALLFADVLGFSTFPESTLPGFWSGFMTDLGRALDRAGEAVLYRNTWGDALYCVLTDAGAAADLALAVQEETARWRAGNRAAPNLRIGLHHGPVYRGWDPICRTVNYYGTQVSRAARVEPIVPPGQVYVTEPFAAVLAATGAGDAFETEYVGVVSLAKKYGEHRMYRLARGVERSAGG